MPAPTSVSLLRLADAVIQPGFTGTSAPSWVLRRLSEGLGGVALYDRNVESLDQVAALTTALRAERPDIVVAIDEEAGDVTRLESRYGSSRPGNYALGFVDDVELTARIAYEVGRDLADAGITLDYAPDADVNSNPDNPVIGVRAFGEDPCLVARHTVAWVSGLQAAGVGACVKHFPGHGDTSVDSHEDLPIVTASRPELEKCALVPFRAAIEAGVRAVMSGHLLIPALDPMHPATMSRAVLQDLLRDELGFAGLMVTDGIEMKAVTARYGLAGAVVRAIAAGCDAVCVGGDHADEQTAVHIRDAVAAAVVAGELSEERLTEAAARVASFAAWSLTARRWAILGEPVTRYGLDAARRAIEVTGGADVLPLRSAPHVVELSPTVNVAIVSTTPWGVAEPLARRLPGTTAVRLSSSDMDRLASAALGPAADRPLVVVVRDAHRHAWLAAALRVLTAARPDAIVVEMGLSNGLRPGSAYVATHGATRASGEAAAEVLTGPR